VSKKFCVAGLSNDRTWDNGDGCDGSQTKRYLEDDAKLRHSD
jgi:hypothetical protein